MGTLELDVIKDQCLGKEVLRGSAKAKDLAPALWIDFYDRTKNRYGYQRPFNQKRSNDAAKYAETVADAFWPECILAIRDNDEVDDEEDKVYYKFQELPSTSGRFGKLTVTYNESHTEDINGQKVPWRRAFSQVDCQHRLGMMSESDRYVTFCIFPKIKQREEAIIFKTINDNQKKISTSLVDAIVLLTDPNAPVQLRWAWDLAEDSGSPFNGIVDTGGRDLTVSRPVSLRTLVTCATVIIPPSTLDLGGRTLGYVFLRNFWNAVAQLWSKEFGDASNYKLRRVPGLKALARFGQDIFRAGLDTQDMTESRIKSAFRNDPTLMDWSALGPLRQASGNAGIRMIYDALKAAYP